MDDCVDAENHQFSFGPQSVDWLAMHAVSAETSLSSRLGSSLAHLV